MLLSGRSLVRKESFMASYNYSGSKKWSTKERQRFRRAWRDNQKDFRAIHSNVSTLCNTLISVYAVLYSVHGMFLYSICNKNSCGYLLYLQQI